MRYADAMARRGVGSVILLMLALAAWAGRVEAGDGSWSVEVEPVYLEALGHDQHVLTTRDLDTNGAPATDRANAVTLDTEAALGYKAMVLYDRGRWDYGVDFLIYRTDQVVDPILAAADGAGGAIDARAFEVAGRSFSSTAPSQQLYYQTLEDTTVELWILDLYASRELAAGEAGTFSAVLGVRNADFDNDYRAVAGVEGVGGVRIDASSNYSRMIGPLVGIAARFERGRLRWGGDLRQSVVLGEIELKRTLRDFRGPSAPFAVAPEEVPEGYARDDLKSLQDIAVPMTDVRLHWAVGLSKRISLGVSLGATAWWDLAVPPGVQPGPGRDEELNETTIITYGLGATVRVTF